MHLAILTVYFLIDKPIHSDHSFFKGICGFDNLHRFPTISKNQFSICNEFIPCKAMALRYQMLIKIAFNTFYRTRKSDWGWQTEIDGVPVYLMHFPIRGPAAVRVEELKELKRASAV